MDAAAKENVTERERERERERSSLMEPNTTMGFRGV